jgi:hypothetical protein
MDCDLRPWAKGRNPVGVYWIVQSSWSDLEPPILRRACFAEGNEGLENLGDAFLVGALKFLGQRGGSDGGTGVPEDFENGVPLFGQCLRPREFRPALFGPRLFPPAPLRKPSPTGRVVSALLPGTGIQDEASESGRAFPPRRVRGSGRRGVREFPRPNHGRANTALSSTGRRHWPRSAPSECGSL